jgi:hypothetical protein
MSILTYTNDLITYLMHDWVVFMDTKLCDYEAAQCGRDMSVPVHPARTLQFFVFDPSWAMVQEFLQHNTTNYFYEKLLIFDDWEENLPVITKERAATPEEATLEFFSLSQERRSAPLNYTVQYQNQDTVSLNKIKRSIWEFSFRIRLGGWVAPRFMDSPNIARGFHFAVREI